MGLELRSQRVVEVVTDLRTDQRLLHCACRLPSLKVPWYFFIGYQRNTLIVSEPLAHTWPELYGSLLINISDRFLTVKSAEKEISHYNRIVVCTRQRLGDDWHGISRLIGKIKISPVQRFTCSCTYNRNRSALVPCFCIIRSFLYNTNIGNSKKGDW